MCCSPRRWLRNNHSRNPGEHSSDAICKVPPGAAPDGNAQSAKPNTDNTQGESAVPNEGKQPQSGMPQGLQHASNAIKQVNATVSWATIGWMLLIGSALTLLASLTAAIFVMRYEPLQILADRS